MKRKTQNAKRKIEKLERILRKLKSVVVAYSGGVDSTFLVAMAFRALGRNNVIAVTAKSELFPKTELNDAKKIARHMRIKHIIIKTSELKNKKFIKNPINRCYYCKKELFSKLKKIAEEKKMAYVIDGTNFDDLKDLRFGRKAALELGIRSPLMEAGLRKDEIRNISKNIKLPTWNKSTFACLASRFSYGQKINQKELNKIEKLEDFLKNLGFKQVRTRLHKDLVRLEVGADEITCFVSNKIRKKVLDKSEKLGLAYIALDLKGYRTGSMNEAITRA